MLLALGIMRRDIIRGAGILGLEVLSDAVMICWARVGRPGVDLGTASGCLAPRSAPTLSQARSLPRVFRTSDHGTSTAEVLYNFERQLAATFRRNMVVRRFMEMYAAPGAKAQIAREFGVHRSTVTRDIALWSGEQVSSLCPTCFRPVSNADWKWIAEARKHPTAENPLSDAAEARRAAIKAIREELPRVLADLDLFEDDDGSEPTNDGPRLIPPKTINDIATRVADRATSAA
jgi:hypothetical protein